jgi:hypothetical protein
MCNGIATIQLKKGMLTVRYQLHGICNMVFDEKYLGIFLIPDTLIWMLVLSSLHYYSL